MFKKPIELEKLRKYFVIEILHRVVFKVEILHRVVFILFLREVQANMQFSA